MARHDRLDGGDVKLLLYRTLHGVWRQTGGPPEQGPVGPVVENEAIVAARVGQLGPAKRQILMLTVLEGFSVAEAAAVMGLSLACAQSLLGQAKEELRWQRPSRILIIEDEAIIALDVATTIRASGHTVVGIATTHDEAVAMARSGAPELLLADIQLADDSSGLEAAREILGGRYLPVIFITAFPERLLTGTRPEPTFLLTKPFDAETLRIAIAQALAATRVKAPALVQ